MAFAGRMAPFRHASLEAAEPRLQVDHAELESG